MHGRLVESVILAFVLAGIAGRARSAPNRMPDEAAIRALIAQRDAGKAIPSTPDRVFWAAAFQRPIVGDETPTPRTHDRGIENRVPGSTRTTTIVRRIVLSEAGDMAYEYSDGTLTFDLKSGAHITSPNSTLRVWQKIDGQWTMAASFTITHFRD